MEKNTPVATPALEQLAEMQRLEGRLSLAGKIDSVCLMLALLAMATAHYRRVPDDGNHYRDTVRRFYR